MAQKRRSFSNTAYQASTCLALLWIAHCLIWPERIRADHAASLDLAWMITALPTFAAVHFAVHIGRRFVRLEWSGDRVEAEEKIYQIATIALGLWLLGFGLYYP